MVVHQTDSKAFYHTVVKTGERNAAKVVNFEKHHHQTLAPSLEERLLLPTAGGVGSKSPEGHRVGQLESSEGAKLVAHVLMKGKSVHYIINKASQIVDTLTFPKLQCHCHTPWCTLDLIRRFDPTKTIIKN